MRAPIPSDYDGDSWRCVRVEWPDSAEWLAILHGVLSIAMRGRFWAGDTGVITEAQAIGREIWSRNTPLRDCNGDESGDIAPPGGIDRIVCAGVAVSDVMEWINVITKVYIDYETSELVVQSGQCCEERFALPETGLTSYPQPGDDAWQDLPDDYPTATACTKAHALVDMVAGIVDAMTDAAYSNIDPFGLFAAARQYAPAIDFGDSALFSAATAAINVVAVGAVEEAENPDFVQQLKCTLEALFEDGQAGITKDQYKSAVDTVRTQAQKWFPVTEWGLVAAPLQVLWGDTIAAIGPNDAQALTSGLQPADDENCLCPGEKLYDYPSDATWLAVYDFTEASHGWIAQEGIYTLGVGWEGTDNWGNGSRLNQVHAPAKYIETGLSGQVRYVRLEWDAGTIDPGAVQNGQGIHIERQNQGDLVIASITELRTVGSGVHEVSGYWPYSGSQNVEFEVDISLDDISRDRILMSKVVIAGTGEPPVADAVVL